MNPENRRFFGVLFALAALAVCLLGVVILSGTILIRQTRITPAATHTAVPTAAPVVLVASPSPTAPLPDLPPAFVETAEVQPPATDSVRTPTGVTVTATPGDIPAEAGAEVGGDCPHPDGWELHQVQPGETLFAYVLGAGGTITTDELRQINCLSSDLLQIGQPLYLPPGAAENAPSSDPIAAPGTTGSGPRTPECVPHCTISIRPGWRAEQIAQAIDTIPLGFWGSDFLAAIGPGAGIPAYDFLSSKPAGASLEGFLYPGTYELSNDTTAAGFRDMLLAAFSANYSPDMSASAAAHGLTFYEAVTLASIIQRESWAYSEQVLISSVFHNRLRTGDKLGSTVTTQYYYGAPGNWWPRISGSQINTNNPYNTNINAGLPATPIDSPSIDTIRAALSPADTNYLFFTGNCRGSGNVYAATYDEHLANVNACR